MEISYDAEVRLNGYLRNDDGTLSSVGGFQVFLSCCGIEIEITTRLPESQLQVFKYIFLDDYEKHDNTQSRADMEACDAMHFNKEEGL